MKLESGNGVTSQAPNTSELPVGLRPAAERPIELSGQELRAILEGRKTQTRQVVAPENCRFGSAPPEFWEHGDFPRGWRDGQRGEFVDGKYRVIGRGALEYLHVPCHAKESGECERCDSWDWTGTTHRLWPEVWPFDQYVGPKKERPPHRLLVNGTRLRLEVVTVRVERVQEISHEDALAEGVQAWIDSLPEEQRYADLRKERLSLKQLAWSYLWDSLNAARGSGWDANPWVWAIAFKPLFAFAVTDAAQITSGQTPIGSY